jgi:hypothetical protein
MLIVLMPLNSTLTHLVNAGRACSAPPDTRIQTVSLTR